MRRRTFLAVTAAAGVTGLAGCESAERTDTGGGDGSTDGEADDDETPTGTASPAASATSTDGRVPLPDAFEFDREGDAASEPFSLDGLMTEISFQHSGSDAFVVDLVDPEGEADDYRVVDDSGLVSGVRGQGVPEGEYVLEVAADGPWVVRIQQRLGREAPEAEPPVEIDGDAYGDVFLLGVDRTATVAAEHDGDGRFRVESYDRRGREHDDTTLFNKLGSFEDDTTLEYDGKTWITVQATDDWSLSFANE